MSVSNQTSEVQYSTNGSSKTFTITFPYLDETHIVVTYTNPSGVDATLTLVTDYTIDEIIDGDVIQTFEVTTVATYPTGGKLTIQRIVPLTQETDYVENSSFPAESHEKALDKLTMAAQQLLAEINRALRLKATSTGVDAELPSPEADTFLGWNSTATGLINLQSNAVPPNPTFTSVTTTDDINVGKDLIVGNNISGISVDCSSIVTADIFNGNRVNIISSDCSSIATASIFVGALQGNALTATTATNVTTNINGKAITDIFESNGTTVKNATVATNLPAGSIVQVVSVTKTDVFTTSSNTYTNVTGLSLSITPKSSSNKILVLGSLSISTAGGNCLAQVVRDSTAIANGSSAGSNGFTMVGANSIDSAYSLAFNYLDSPNKNTSTTYKMQVAAAGTVKVNARGVDTAYGTSSTITLLEVQG